MAKDTKAGFWGRDTTPGYVLLAATAVSFLLLNGPLEPAVHHALEDAFARIAVGAVTIPVNWHIVINDGLMAIFFLYVGLELKRETVEGPFRNPREAALPIVGAAGGMAVPALIYLMIAGAADPSYVRGWAIPAATDIAFAIGVLSLLGARVPPGLRLFLLALAIIDDLGAILVIALFYTTNITGWALGGALVSFLVMLGMNRAGVKSLLPYWLLGAVTWGFMLLSGVHATMAGVLTALAVPMRAPSGKSPLVVAEHTLKPWVQFGIMPLFAVVNAGVPLAGATAALFTHPITLGVGLGLLIGKPIGILASAYAAAKVLKRNLPCGPGAMLGMACVAGIGFTMSLFVGTLAFGQGELAAPVRIGVLGGSLCSALVGLAILAASLRAEGRVRDADLAREEEIAERAGIIEDIDPPTTSADLASGGADQGVARTPSVKPRSSPGK
ncbi:MAG: Na+/H+ antiporter NhaA [Hyphomonadaceae bacterium]|nr:Na+/H+ antiporter NhaA [Hyphomonadaceae bacterium]